MRLDEKEDEGLPKSKLTVFGRPYRSSILWWVLAIAIIAGAIGAGVYLKSPENAPVHGR